MVSTAIAAEVTSAIRDFSAGVEMQGRAIGSSVRDLVRPTTEGDTSRIRIGRDIQIPPTQLIGWVANALYAATAHLAQEVANGIGGDGRVAEDYVIVDRARTRC